MKAEKKDVREAWAQMRTCGPGPDFYMGSASSGPRLWDREPSALLGHTVVRVRVTVEIPTHHTTDRSE